MAVDVKVPGVGESVQEGMIETWHKKTGDYVELDEVLLELETDKATVEIVAESSGVIEVLKDEGEVVKVGDILARIDDTAQASSGGAQPAQTQQQDAPTPQAPLVQAQQQNAQHLDPGPAVRHMAAEQNIDVSSIPGTGRGGRVTKGDVIASQNAAPASQQAPKKADAPSKSAEPSPSLSGERETTVKPMSMIRRRIAERLISAQQTAAILTTFNEVDMTAVMATRKKYKDKFQEKHGIKLGFMGFFLKAAVAALEEFPLVNAYIEGTDIHYHNYCDIGVAVSTAKGLMVPIIRDVDQMSLAQVEGAIAGYAAKARDNKISLSDLEGGTFTVSNGGVFGSLLSTPILNPPQSAILGMHKTQQRPMVMDNGEIKARPMMYLALSYDHRIIDGKEAVGFLVKIKEAIEDPARLLLGV